MEDSSEQIINVKFRPSTGDGFDYRFDPGQLTVQQLKEKLALHTTIPANSMRLVYSGRVLKDEDMVELYGEQICIMFYSLTNSVKKKENKRTTFIFHVL